MFKIFKTLVASIVLAIGFAGASMAAQTIQYSPDSKAFTELQNSGKPYVLGFWASWCPNCKRQQAIIDELQNADAKYKDITIVYVDWDDYKRAPIARDNNIRSRTSIVLFANGQNLGALQSTRKDRIQGLLDKAV